MLCEMHSISSRIWTRVAVSIPYDDNHYTTSIFFNDPRIYVTVVEGDTKYHLPVIRIIMLSVKQGGIKYHFWVCGRIRLVIEPKSPELLAKTQTIIPIRW